MLLLIKISTNLNGGNKALDFNVQRTDLKANSLQKYRKLKKCKLESKTNTLQTRDPTGDI